MIPVIIALIYGESSGIYFAVCGAACLVVGTHMTHKKSGNRSFFAKEGFVSVSLSWIVLSIIGALPFVLSGVIPNPVDAMFEIVSGFTTTGASILPEVESLPKFFNDTATTEIYTLSLHDALPILFWQFCLLEAAQKSI